MALPAGTRLGPYEVLSPLGAGGMGEVYRARDTRLDREVAIKVLPERLAADTKALSRFEREAKAVAALSHPNILAIHDFGEDHGVRFAVTELLEGETLRERLNMGVLAPRKAVEIAVQIANGLAAAHEKGIVHRDLKPENVFVTKEGRVKILDFGLAKVTESQESGPVRTEAVTPLAESETGVVLGTPGYMSPEQVQGLAADHRSDIFGFGAVLYEMLSGNRAFKGASTIETLHAILKDDPPQIGGNQTDVSPALERVVRRCLEKRHDERFQSARDVGFALEALSSGREIRRGYEKEAGRSVSKEATHGEAPRTEEGFWVAVQPFKYRSTDANLAALAEGLTVDIVTGLSRFSYLRVMALGSTSKLANEAVDVRSAGKELCARYVMEGSLRQEGARLRVAVQLVDAISGAHLWAETYDRPFSPGGVFELQDDLVPRIVSTVADGYGALPYTMSEELRSRAPEELSPYETVLRSFGYVYRLTLEEHLVVRAALERTVQKAPGYADAWAMLSRLITDEFALGVNAQPNPLGRALQAARRAVDAAPLNAHAHNALAKVLFFRKELQAFRSAADRAIALNPMDGSIVAFMGQFIAFAGDWEHGCGLVERAMQLNPRHPGWYWFPLFWRAYRKGDYRGALTLALKIDSPSFFGTHEVIAAAYGQLGEFDSAGKVLRELLTLRPDFAVTARELNEKWFQPELVELIMDGLRKAGLEVKARP